MIVKNSTIIITDPCYLRHGTEDGLWSKSNYGEDLSVFGCTNYISEPTIYGDWGCTLYKTRVPVNEILQVLENEACLEDSESVGEFCADAGMVCVVELDELETVNPKFARWALEHPWCVAHIINFTGKVSYNVVNGSAYIIAEGDDGVNYVSGQTSL